MSLQSWALIVAIAALINAIAVLINARISARDARLFERIASSNVAISRDSRLAKSASSLASFKRASMLDIKDSSTNTPS